jgi:hypothetical protein
MNLLCAETWSEDICNTEVKDKENTLLCAETWSEDICNTEVKDKEKVIFLEQYIKDSTHTNLHKLVVTLDYLREMCIKQTKEQEVEPLRKRVADLEQDVQTLKALCQHFKIFFTEELLLHNVNQTQMMARGQRLQSIHDLVTLVVNM